MLLPWPVSATANVGADAKAVLLKIGGSYTGAWSGGARYPGMTAFSSPCRHTGAQQYFYQWVPVDDSRQAEIYISTGLAPTARSIAYSNRAERWWRSTSLYPDLGGYRGNDAWKKYGGLEWGKGFPTLIGYIHNPTSTNRNYGVRPAGATWDPTKVLMGVTTNGNGTSALITMNSNYEFEAKAGDLTTVKFYYTGYEYGNCLNVDSATHQYTARLDGTPIDISASVPNTATGIAGYIWNEGADATGEVRHPDNVSSILQIAAGCGLYFWQPVKINAGKATISCVAGHTDVKFRILAYYQDEDPDTVRRTNGDIYPNFLAGLSTGAINLGGTIKAMLLTQAYTRSAAHQYVNDLSGEVTGGSYARQTVAGNWTFGDTSYKFTPSGPITFSGIPGSISWMVFYQEGANDASSRIIASVNLGTIALNGQGKKFSFVDSLFGLPFLETYPDC